MGDAAGVHLLLELVVLRLDLRMRDLEGLLEAPLGLAGGVPDREGGQGLLGVRHLRRGGRIRVHQADAASTPATHREAGSTPRPATAPPRGLPCQPQHFSAWTWRRAGQQAGRSGGIHGNVPSHLHVPAGHNENGSDDPRDHGECRRGLHTARGHTVSLGPMPQTCVTKLKKERVTGLHRLRFRCTRPPIELHWRLSRGI